MSSDEDWLKLWDLAQSIAHNVARRNPGVEEDELLGQLGEFLAKAAAKGKPLDIDDEKQCKYLLYRAAGIEAGKLRAEAYAHVVQYDYRSDDVKDILPYVFGEPEDYVYAPNPEDDAIARSSGDRVDAVLDIKQALSELGTNDYDALVAVHRDGLEEKSSRYYRSLRKLCNQASKYKRERWQEVSRNGYPGARTPINRAHAQHLIDNME